MRILSGIQPTGQLHLGNYVGMIKPALQLQNKHDCFFMIADLHALTTVHSPEELRHNIVQTMRTFLALGFDPKKCVLFAQSAVPQHSELGWILQTVTPLGELERMTQFKEKSQQHALVDVGLLTYPALQAADILLYKTEGVPVGEDQIQHLELTRTLAHKMNNTFGKKIFTEPKALLAKNAARIMSLHEPTKKMSKSLGAQHVVGIFEEEKSIREKIQRAVTDSYNEIHYDPEERPAISNLVMIFSQLTGTSVQSLERKYKGKGYGDFKKDLADAVVAEFLPIQKRYQALKESAVKKVFAEGAKQAEKEAETMMKTVRQGVGLR